MTFTRYDAWNDKMLGKLLTYSQQPLRLCLATAFAVVLLSAATKITRAETPQRIVSINLCTDQFVLALADHDQIAGVSRAGKDPFYSPLADRTAGLADHRGGAEEIVMMRPDLVVAGPYANRQTVQMLARLNVPILNVPSVNKITELFPEIRRVADRVGRPERGAELAQTLETQYHSFVVDHVRGTGAIYLSGGYILGKDTIVDDVMRAAGLSNVGANIGVRGEDRLALETLILSPPDFLVLDLSRPERPSLGRRMLKHPAVAKMPVAHEVMELPVQYWLCSTPSTVEGAAQLTARVTEHLGSSVSGGKP